MKKLMMSVFLVMFCFIAMESFSCEITIYDSIKEMTIVLQSKGNIGDDVNQCEELKNKIIDFQDIDSCIQQANKCNSI